MQISATSYTPSVVLVKLWVISITFVFFCDFIKSNGEKRIDNLYSDDRLWFPALLRRGEMITKRETTVQEGVSTFVCVKPLDVYNMLWGYFPSVLVATTTCVFNKTLGITSSSVTTQPGKPKRFPTKWLPKFLFLKPTRPQGQRVTNVKLQDKEMWSFNISTFILVIFFSLHSRVICSFISKGTLRFHKLSLYYTSDPQVDGFHFDVSSFLVSFKMCFWLSKCYPEVIMLFTYLLFVLFSK